MFQYVLVGYSRNGVKWREHVHAGNVISVFRMSSYNGVFQTFFVYLVSLFLQIFHPASKFNTDLLRCFRILQSVHPVLYRKCKKAAQKALDGSDIDGISLCRSPALTFVIPEPNYANLTKTDPLDWEEAKKFRGQLEVQISSLIQTEVTDTQGVFTFTVDFSFLYDLCRWWQ